MKFKYPEGKTGQFTLYPLLSLSVSSDILLHILTIHLTSVDVIHNYLECSHNYLARSKGKEGNLVGRCYNAFLLLLSFVVIMHCCCSLTPCTIICFDKAHICACFNSSVEFRWQKTKGRNLPWSVGSTLILRIREPSNASSFGNKGAVFKTLTRRGNKFPLKT